MSSRSKSFQCRWQASRALLAAYLLGQLLAWLALGLLDIPLTAALAGLALCLGHALWVVPRGILFRHRRSFLGLRHDQTGWQVYSQYGGWQPLQVCADSLALPIMIVLRFRLLHGQRPERLPRTLCIPRDALTPDSHRRLRVLLKFARHA